MEHHRFARSYNTYSRDTIVASKDVYFGKRRPCLGAVKRWECGGWNGDNASRKFPFEQECEECGWMINYMEDMVMQLGVGYYGKMHYHKHCWELKLKDNRDLPYTCKRYGFGVTWRDIEWSIDPDWVWNKDLERFEKECIDCKKMMRANPYTQAEKHRTISKLTNYKDGDNICGRCYNKRISHNVPTREGS